MNVTSDIFNFNLVWRATFCGTLFFWRKSIMISAQIERLKKDSRQLGYAIARYRKQGRTDRMAKVLFKKLFLDEQIAEIQRLQTVHI